MGFHRNSFYKMRNTKISTTQVLKCYVYAIPSPQLSIAPFCKTGNIKIDC